MRKSGRDRAARALLAFFLCVPGVPASADDQSLNRVAAPPLRGAAIGSKNLTTGKKLSLLDAGLLTGGTGLMILGGCGLRPKKRDVPREGLAPSEIRLGVDRSSVRRRTHRPIEVGNTILYGTLVHPAALGIATARDGGRRSVCAEALAYQAEALLLAGGTTLVLKKIVSRPRPYTYLPVYERSERGANWATSDQALESFPSGHATTAWASSTVAVSSLAIRRADLSPAAHFLNGFVAGGLAMSTSLLRVKAGMHFPTDIAMGAVAGAAAGTIVPLAHRGFGINSRQVRSLKWGWLGIGGGCAIALLLTPPASPWIN